MNEIEKIINENRDLLTIKEAIVRFNTRFSIGSTVENLELSQSHWIIAAIAKYQKAGKYAEIGSHCGRSAIAVTVSNPLLEINCYDAPNSGYGGQSGTDQELERGLEMFAKGKYHVNYGDSKSQQIKDKIKELGPYQMAFVDGDHSNAGALGDLTTMYANLNNGGFLILDDLTWHPDLESVWDKFVIDMNPSESFKILILTPEEIALNYVQRGIGILIK